MTSLTLAEYEARSVELPETVANELAAAARTRLRITVDGHHGRYQIEATQYVGSIVVPGASILIRPKVPLENVFLLLEAVSEPEWRAETFEWDANAGILPAFAAFYARTLEAIVARGIYRSYRTEEAWIPTLRGRLDLNAQFRRPGVAVPIPCRYDEFTDDVLENQVLKAALLRLTQVAGVPVGVHRRLRRLRTFFENVSDARPDPSAVERLHIHRLNKRYEPALRLAQLILKNLTLADARGNRSASSFLIDMNVLFEKFVTQRLRKLLRTHLEVDAQPTVHLARGKKVSMQPDLVFRRHGEPIYVGDTKYKILGDRLGRDRDYYQMLAYTTALDLPEGVLIYCTADGAHPERVVEVIHTEKRLWTYPVDLSGSPANVDRSLHTLAAWIRERSRASSARLRLPA